MLESIRARSEVDRAEKVGFKRTKYSYRKIERGQKEEHFRKVRRMSSEAAYDKPGDVYEYKIARKAKTGAEFEILATRLKDDEVCKAYEQFEGENIAVDVVIKISEKLLV